MTDKPPVYDCAARVDECRTARDAAQARIDAGALPAFRDDSRALRDAAWRVTVAGTPAAEPRRLDLGTLLDEGNASRHYDIRDLRNRGEARLYADCFAASDDTVHATVTVDNVHAAFELDEIVYELRAHAVALHWHRDAYLLSFIRTFHRHAEFVLPDRRELAIGAPFLRALGKYAAQLGARRGIRVAGFPAPSPDSVNPVEAADLLQIHKGKITADGVRENLRLAGDFLAGGDGNRTSGALALAQLWQWVHHVTGVLDVGTKVDVAMLAALLEDEAGETAERLLERVGASTPPA